MHRTASTADISEYKMSDTGAIKLQVGSNLVLLIASLVMIAVGKYLLPFLWEIENGKKRKKC